MISVQGELLIVGQERTNNMARNKYRCESCGTSWHVVIKLIPKRWAHTLLPPAEIPLYGELYLPICSLCEAVFYSPHEGDELANIIRKVKLSKDHDDLYKNYYIGLMDTLREFQPKQLSLLIEAKLNRRIELSKDEWFNDKPISFPQDPYDDEMNDHYNKQFSHTRERWLPPPCERPSRFEGTK